MPNKTFAYADFVEECDKLYSEKKSKEAKINIEFPLFSKRSLKAKSVQSKETVNLLKKKVFCPQFYVQQIVKSR